MRSTLGSWRGREDENLYARATPQEAEIIESYSVTQEISKNRSLQLEDEHAGHIEIKLPYDGRDYFTRQAADDVEHRLASRPGTGEQQAVIGHLMLIDHGKTDLGSIVRRHNQIGVIPLAVPVNSADGNLELTADRTTCVIEYDYRPERPPNYPIELDIDLFDPDSLSEDLYKVEVLTKLGETKPSEVIEKLRQEASFSSELLLAVVVRFSLPVKKNYPQFTPMIRHMSVGWPTITSLDTTRLHIRDHLSGWENPKVHQKPVRYNPDKQRLEWENIPAYEFGKQDDGKGSGVRFYRTEVMVLSIGHPGELFKEENLTVKADAEIPEYLLSGLDARLFDATGDKVDAIGGRRGNQPELITKLDIRTELYPADIFAGRTFSPYQQFFFDDIVPDEMRITDIVTVLRNSRFTVEERWSDPENKSGSETRRWLLTARRSQGPDNFDLLVAIEGTRSRMDREQLMAGSMVKISGGKESGQLKISVLGMLPRNHQELTREMNALQQALRDRFQFQQTSRR
jgi:hypothetical protein